MSGILKLPKCRAKYILTCTKQNVGICMIVNCYRGARVQTGMIGRAPAVSTSNSATYCH